MTDHELLLEILARLARLECAVERLAPAPKLSRTDLRALTTLLPALFAAFGEVPFKANEAIDVARSRGIVSTPKRLGKLFGRARGVFVAGHTIEEMARESNSRLWAVRAFGLSGEFSDVKAA